MAEPNDKELRGPVNLRIKFRSASLQQFIERYGVDVSRGGIFIRTREPLPVGTRLKLDFQLVDAAPLFQGDGTVVWIREYDPGKTGVTPGMGVRFDRLTPESQPTLDKILDEKMRLQQTGVAPGGAATAGAGLAVRRPSGVITALDARTTPKAPPPPPVAAVEVKMGAPAVGAAPATTMPASQPRSGPVASSSGGGVFSRPRTTSGMSSLRGAPAPSALFEAPTAADIDNALLALEEKGPTPSMPVAPPPPPVSVARTSNMGDDEPTKVFDAAAQEFAVQEAVTGQSSSLADSGVPVATDGTNDDLTAKREVEPSGPVPAVGQSAPGRDFSAPMGSLDAPLAAHLDGTAPVAAPAASAGRRDTPASAAAAAAAAAAAGIPKKIVLDQAGRGIESGRFRSDAKYRRSNRKAGKVVVAVLLAGVAAAGVVFGKREYDKRKAAAIATAPAPAEIAAPVAPPPAPDNAAAAPSPPVPPTEAKPETPPVAAPTNPPTPEPVTATPKLEKAEKVEKPDKASGEKSARAGGEKAGPADEARPSKSGRRKSAATAETAAVPAPDKTEKTAATAPAGDKAPAAEAAAGSEAPKAAEAAPAEKPVLKITSSPTGAEVVIDGSSVGTTPYSSKDVDPTAAHAITVRKDGFEAHERMISGSDWTKSRSGTQSLKMNIKLKRTGPSPSEAAPPKDEGKASDVEILTPGEP